MKKAILLVIIMLFTLPFCFSQIIVKQTHIRMDNIKGIPYSNQQGELFVDGFEVDNDGCYYFLNGDTKSSLIVKFKGNQLIYRKKNNIDPGAQMHIYNNKIYIFSYIKNSLSVFGIDGTLINKISNITLENVNNYRFLNDDLVIDILGKDENNTMSYRLYDLTGKKIKDIANEYDLPTGVYNYQQSNDPKYLGKWNDNYLFWSISDLAKVDRDKFWITDVHGKVLAIKYLPSKQFGQTFEEMAEFEKLRNGNIVIFGHNGRDGIITEISVENLFK